MSRLKRSLAIFALVSQIAAPAQAQDALIRASADQFSEAVDRLLAARAAALDLNTRAPAIGADDTAGEVIVQLCGSIRPAYVAEFELRNGAGAPSLEDVVGDRAASLVWPACLYVQPLQNVSVEVQPGQTATQIFREFTGGPGSQAELSAFFGRTMGELNAIAPGDRLAIPYRTAAVDLGVPAEDRAQFIEQLRAISLTMRDSAAVRVIAPEPPRFVLGLTSGSRNGCAPEEATSPFEIDALREALAFAKARIEADGNASRPETAEVAIVDNGFFGADPDRRFEGSAFQQTFFRDEGDSVIGQVINVGGKIEPLNDPHLIPLTPQSGHGTHVAGLVLGGPAFRPYWDEVSPDRGWARLTIINVGRGMATLVDGSVEGLFSPLSRDFDIVNMSVAYDARTNADLSGEFAEIFNTRVQTLFIVAAGNQSSPASEAGAVPAMLGGPAGRNVISVAAHRRDGSLAPFSNYSGEGIDLAAPGCGLQSWLGNTLAETPLDGTSQAAPLVTFAASLLKWLRPDLKPWELKARLIASGELIVDGGAPGTQPTREGESTADGLAYRVKLNIPRALFLTEDYVRVSGADAGEYLGDVMNVSLRCNGTLSAKRDLWAFKRETAEAGWLYGGRSAQRLSPPCLLQTGGQRPLEFAASYQIVDGEVTALDAPRILFRPFEEVDELILRARAP